MKVAIASDDGEHIAAHTGRCRGFAVYEIGDGTALRLGFRRNTFTAHARGECQGERSHGGGAAHHTHAPLVGAVSDCTTLVSRGLGLRLVNDLAAAGIDAYVCNVERVDDAAALMAEGLLQRVPGSGCDRHR
jgi:predicted Fe-Mo cluster-binding NifX family protein